MFKLELLIYPNVKFVNWRDLISHSTKQRTFKKFSDQLYRKDRTIN